VAGGRCEKCGQALDYSWHAHHVRQYVNGGVTEIMNGMALCSACHIQIHRGEKMKMMPRGWQKKAFNAFKAEGRFLLDATPGSGKTIFSGLCAQHLIHEHAVDFVVCVVPTSALKGDREAGFLGDYNKVGVQLTTVLKDSRPAPKDFDGAVICYQQLPNIVKTFESWAKNGQRLFFVFDEIHHASSKNIWGSATDRCGAIATKVLAMTGTPFRGDYQKISFVNYNGDGKCVADYSYSYREAVRDSVCREILFMHDDGIAEYEKRVSEGKIIIEKTRISESNDYNSGKVAATIFKHDSLWLKSVLEKADASLNQYRISDADAGGLIICRPGEDDNDDKHLMNVARTLRNITGEMPIVITHEDLDANLKIEQFRSSGAKWICAVRKISEGVDIKRLRVLVMANYTTTELLFRQMVGRIVRVEDKNANEDATVFMAKFPMLVEWGRTIADEAKAGIEERENLEPKEPKRPKENRDSGFRPIGSTHEDGGAFSDYGEHFSNDEIYYAESFKQGDPQMSNLPVAKIAHIFKKAGVPIPKREPVEEPLHAQKVKCRLELNNLVRRYALKKNRDNPDFGAVWSELNKILGVKNLDDLMDNHPIEHCRQAIEIVKGMLAS